MSAHYETLPNGNVKVTYDRPEENPRYGELGMALTVGGNVTKESVEKVLALLHEDARNTLPPGTIYDIRATLAPPGRQRGVAWYHVKAMAEWKVTGEIPWPGRMNPLGGYIQLGTFRTPEAS